MYHGLGKTCNISAKNICNPNHCGDNGICRPVLNSDEFFCDCFPGYFGDFCESTIEGNYYCLFYNIYYK